MKKWLPVATLLAVSLAAAPFALAADDGKTLYDSKCAMCHGKDGVAKSMAKGSANLNDPKWQEANSVDAIAKTITDGKGKMPAEKDKLTADQIKAIAAYVKTIK
jgi:mono/diheme cytochrome c family protein